MLPRSGDPIKKLGDLRRMLALRDLAELSIAGLHQWNDEAQLKLGELHALVQATWFRPSTTTLLAQAAGGADAGAGVPTQAPAVPTQSQSQSQSQSQTETPAAVGVQALGR